MTLNQFKDKYLGKQVEFHSFGGADTYNQCVDLVNQYIKDVLGLTPIIGTHAKDFPAKYNKDQFEWIPNNPNDDKFPQPGDIVVWNGRVGGGAGHIAIALNSTPAGFTSLDQNWSKKQVVTTENHKYTNVSGWLHPKKGTDMTIDEATFNKLVANSTKWDGVHKYLELGGDPATTALEQATNSIGGLKSRATDLQNQLAKAEAEVKNRDEQVGRLKQQLAESAKLEIDLRSKLNSAIADLQKMAGEYDGRISVLQGQVDDLAREKGALNTQVALLEAENAQLKKGIQTDGCFTIFINNLKKLFER